MKATMFLLPLLLTVFLSCTKGDLSDTGKEAPASTTVNSSVNRTSLLNLVNTVRQKGCQCGDTYYYPVPPVVWNDQLEAAATAHSRDMYLNNYFSHTAPDGSNAGLRIERAGYYWKAYGENIASGYPDEQSVIDGWINSPGHCKNIMNRSFKEMGVARSGKIWTQEFGAR